ncbi:MAG: hypothetical protein A2842_01970 [Candidatus Wildermuthbacteria bacterium RIFCSPHIGHO2_01_FULL_48_25]|uniref:Uncharacterized protein n=1 Tax=Candidatus Wildermuthbacteria bacterium RIFCSPLOWO2_01_FULL_48_16 TaxID=1802461 RepID=A0A1G2RMD1_9BACT|nr:MAG: hypothetical protein A2842_01970 [Candidatus Wildermuthbacteria bacterium RIFCSPHIGHO2_01_FULL_48_25]OHA69263.1 MAG: hypothetical protein A3J57_01780 [Candidatus Wildermuthbacteria bacterium RIFCSPHIGHO2_02_FULL_49_12b]OHA73442.1 MAG: hypothetical protein A3B24_02435 [Candidatus Wildermuthbacteria bacterium RIFCSPLOWO2_01_FULL_48_16]
MVTKTDQKLSFETGARLVRVLQNAGLTSGDAYRIIKNWRVAREVVDTARTASAERQYHSSLCI